MREALAAEVLQGLKPIARELYAGLRACSTLFADDVSCGRFKLAHYQTDSRVDIYTA